MRLTADLRSRLSGWFKRPPPAAQATRTILVVDGDASDRAAALRCVEQLGYHALEAADASEALRQLESTRPDCVLLALDLPTTSGLDVLAQLREVEPELNVIMLARDWRDARTAEAMRRGAAAYLAKPFSQDDLRELLAS